VSIGLGFLAATLLLYELPDYFVALRQAAGLGGFAARQIANLMLAQWLPLY